MQYTFKCFFLSIASTRLFDSLQICFGFREAIENYRPFEKFKAQ